MPIQRVSSQKAPSIIDFFEENHGDEEPLPISAAGAEEPPSFITASEKTPLEICLDRLSYRVCFSQAEKMALLEEKILSPREEFLERVETVTHSYSHRYWLVRGYDAYHQTISPFASYLDELVDNERIAPAIAGEIMIAAKENPELTQSCLQRRLSSLEIEEIKQALQLYTQDTFTLFVEENDPFHAFDHLLKICTRDNDPNFAPKSLYHRHFPIERDSTQKPPAYFNIDPFDQLRFKVAYLSADTMETFALNLIEHPLEESLLYRLLLLNHLSKQYELLKQHLDSEEHRHLFEKIIYTAVVRGHPSLDPMLQKEELPQETKQILCKKLSQGFEEELTKCIDSIPALENLRPYLEKQPGANAEEIQPEKSSLQCSLDRLKERIPLTDYAIAVMHSEIYLKRADFLRMLKSESKSKSLEYWLLRVYDTEKEQFTPFAAHLDQMVDDEKFSPSTAALILRCHDKNFENECQFSQALLDSTPLTHNEVSEMSYNYSLYHPNTFEKIANANQPFQAFEHLLRICIGVNPPTFEQQNLYRRHIPSVSPRQLTNYFYISPHDLYQIKNIYLKSHSTQKFAFELLKFQMEPQLRFRILLLYKLSHSFRLLREHLNSEEAKPLFEELIQNVLNTTPGEIFQIPETELLTEDSRTELNEEIQYVEGALLSTLVKLKYRLASATEKIPYNRESYEAFFRFLKGHPPQGHNETPALEECMNLLQQRANLSKEKIELLRETVSADRATFQSMIDEKFPDKKQQYWLWRVFERLHGSRNSFAQFVDKLVDGNSGIGEEAAAETLCDSPLP